MLSILISPTQPKTSNLTVRKAIEEKLVGVYRFVSDDTNRMHGNPHLVVSNMSSVIIKESVIFIPDLSHDYVGSWAKAKIEPIDGELIIKLANE